MPQRRKQHDEKAFIYEYDAYSTLAGSMIWEGNLSVPHSAYPSSPMQPTAPRIRVGDLTEATNMLKELIHLAAQFLFRKLPVVVNMQVWTYSEGSSNIISERIYVETGIITGLLLADDSAGCRFHTVHWAVLSRRESFTPPMARRYWRAHSWMIETSV